MIMFCRSALFLMLAGSLSFAETNEPGSTNHPANSPPTASQQQADAVKAEQVRTRCIEGRRYIAGKVLQIVPEGLIVDSGYSRLLSPPFNRSWVVTGVASVSRDPSLVEEKKPDALCAGLVLLSNIPKRPAVKAYDYVVIHGYPAGEYAYAPVPGVQKTIRRFSASLDRAVQTIMERERK
jgi:hypothetical protein